MPRLPRLEFPGAIYHVTVRGVQRAAIFVDDQDRTSLLAILARTLRVCEARAYAYCLMGNHYHLVLQTSLPNVSTLMHRVNSVYSLTFNRRHRRMGQVFEGRFKAIHVDRDAYLLAVCRYVDLNPVRAGIVQVPGQWRWSSYRATIGRVEPPSWLAAEELLGMLEVDAESAKRRYAEWVEAGLGVPLWSASLREGLYLGDNAFVERLKEVGERRLR